MGTLSDSSGWPVHPSQLIVLLPALAAAVSLVLVRRARIPAFVVALLGALGGLAAAAQLLAQQLGGTAEASSATVGPLPLEPVLHAPMRLGVDRFAVLLAVTVAVVALVVQLVARWYLREDRRYAAFAATVSLFTAAMQLVVLSDDVLLTIVGWELMGWCSYLLIGHDSEREKARRAAYKAFLVTRLADAPFAIGLVLLATGAHTTSLSAIVRHWSGQPSTLLTGGLIAVIVGVAGKSAQVPFQDWLPDAMEGPTPASALIHAATMVAAGTVVLGRLLPLLERSDAARTVLVLIAGISTVLAGFLAYCQTDLKRLLAWSTVSQVGLMLLGLAIVPVGHRADLALNHLVAHAMFKALLFLVFGWISVLVGGTVVARMSGAVRAHPATRALVAIGLLSLAGVPPMAGFVSKDLIVDEAATRAVNGDGVSRIAFVALAFSVALTAAYCMRAWLILDHRSVVERNAALEIVEDSVTVQEVGIVELFVTSAQVDRRGREVGQPLVPIVPEPEPEPVTVVAPDAASRLGLRLLALLAVVGGLLVTTPLLSLDWNHPAWALIAATLLLMAAVAVFVRVQSLGTPYGDAAGRLPLTLRSVADRGLGMDGVYVALTRPVVALARLVAGAERGLETGVHSTARGARGLAGVGARLQNGTPTAGLVAVALGVVAVGLIGISLW
ncbi:NADH-quinone oxidoreductase subunit L [Allobranchiibius sp. CTAmp26]|uniref:NADH-quinone oxidoreductase subunit 5 family protein n=1 Tax=Allobranchiibius sp. CTAmp26 TaxID=2815214 RepID=UPI001AA0DFCA|nr:NADH-quinone oxidoreductase subunit L [Allobranchiibius sp. CTAmp26]MBO1756405.1 NADH-quinone oxidoreductase subunit L [Allobranchiibius sp. CTAmp26]